MPRQRVRSALASADQAREGPSVGVIDLGSNTARCVVFDTSPGGIIHAVYETKESPRLGLETGPDGSLPEAAVARGVHAIRRFAKPLRHLGVRKVIGVATSAVRDAPNGPAFVQEVERATAVRLRILSGAEEARYAYLGVAGTLELHNDLVCDLGGGSLQLAEVRDGLLRNSVSLPLGALRLSKRFLEHDPPKRRERDQLRDHARTAIRSAVEALGGHHDRLIAVGGTVRALARASIDITEFPVRRVHGYRLYDRAIEALDELLGEMPTSKRRAVPGIGSDRADVVLAGITVFVELERALGLDHVLVSGAGIREGVALEAIRAKLPVSAEELVDRSVAAASGSFGFDLERAREVAEVADRLFGLLAGRYGWGRGERLALRAASGMHDAGVSIDIWNHPQHSSYLVRNYPIWGLDQREILLASMTAYLQDGDDPPSVWKKRYLPLAGSAEVATAVRLGAILEVAKTVASPRTLLSLAGGGERLAVAFSSGADVTLPSRWQEKVRKAMERVFDLEVRVRDG
ncbi:MAG TPA: Ppx/GppA phosphatase family protein [Thermoplasmata archaeon]|nr:Ppx/GppA phosphatase family protein [Thermoplasmata archaeon]